MAAAGWTYKAMGGLSSWRGVLMIVKLMESAHLAMWRDEGDAAGPPVKGPDRRRASLNRETGGGFVRDRTVAVQMRACLWVWAAVDGTLWFVSIFGATWLRSDYVGTAFTAGTLLVAAMAVAAHRLAVGSTVDGEESR